MKTIKSLLLGIFTLVLSIVSLCYAVVVVSDSTTMYYKVNQSEPTTFTATFVIAGIILFAVGLQLMLFSLAAFKLYRKYYNSYLDDKRDRDVQERVLTEEYNQLSKDLSDAPTIELKKVILKEFYKQEEEETTGNKMPRDFADFMASVLKR